MSKKWYDKAVIYHIYPLGLCSAPERNSFRGRVNSRINELESWIYHLKYLGIDTLYLGPLFESETHGYDTVDYFQLDRRLGTNEDLKVLIEKFHKSGIRVILDGVFNHVSRDFFAFRDVVEKREESKYCNWFKSLRFTNNVHCECWRGCNNLPNLNMDNIEVRNYLLEAVKFWVEEFHIDGLRLDVADVLDKGFMKELSTLTREIREDFWLMGEVIHGDYNNWVNSEMLHSTTNYEVYKGIYSSFNDVNFFEIAYSLNRQFNSDDGIYREMNLYNFVDNHDVDRIKSKVDREEFLFNIYTLLFTIPGVPSIYYGSEWMIEGEKGADSDRELRPFINLDYCNHHFRGDLIEHIHNLSALYSSREELQYGEYREIAVNHDLFIFERTYHNQRILVIINSRDESVEYQLEGYSVNGVDLLNNSEDVDLKQPIKLYPFWGRVIAI